MGNKLLPRIGITAGEPAGIGPDVLVTIAQRRHRAEIVAIADPRLLATRAEALGLPLAMEPFDPGASPAAHAPGVLKVEAVEAVELVEPVRCGVLNQANAPYVIATLKRACEGCLDGTFDAMVTGPVHKGIINDAGIPFTGHTEYLAHAVGFGQALMMLSAPGLRVALATTHVPIADVSALITKDRLVKVLRILARDLRRRFGLPNPTIVVCGLNPHAGEGGHLGTEEIEHIAPAIDAARAEGLRIRGPLPADTVFTPRSLVGVDAVLAMYHDQGLPVLKHRGFGEAVNITLGLPIIRTSVDHGTALELAGTGKIDCGSMLAAIRTAIELVDRESAACASEPSLARAGQA